MPANPLTLGLAVLLLLQSSVTSAARTPASSTKQPLSYFDHGREYSVNLRRASRSNRDYAARAGVILGRPYLIRLKGEKHPRQVIPFDQESQLDERGLRGRDVGLSQGWVHFIDPVAHRMFFGGISWFADHASPVGGVQKK